MLWCICCLVLAKVRFFQIVSFNWKNIPKYNNDWQSLILSVEMSDNIFPNSCNIYWICLSYFFGVSGRILKNVWQSYIRLEKCQGGWDWVSIHVMLWWWLCKGQIFMLTCTHICCILQRHHHWRGLKSLQRKWKPRQRDSHVHQAGGIPITKGIANYSAVSRPFVPIELQ